MVPQTEGRKLTGSVADDGLAHIVESLLESQGHEPRESSPDAEVDLLTGLDGIIHVLVDAVRMLHCSHNITVQQSCLENIR